MSGQVSAEILRIRNKHKSYRIPRLDIDNCHQVVLPYVRTTSILTTILDRGQNVRAHKLEKDFNHEIAIATKDLFLIGREYGMTDLNAQLRNLMLDTFNPLISLSTDISVESSRVKLAQSYGPAQLFGLQVALLSDVNGIALTSIYDREGLAWKMFVQKSLHLQKELLKKLVEDQIDNPDEWSAGMTGSFFFRHAGISHYQLNLPIGSICACSKRVE